MIKHLSWIGLALFLNMGLSACQPKTTAGKVEDKVEDAAHETRQGMERAGEKIKDVTK